MDIKEPVFTKVQDSGKREDMSTGSRRDTDAGKSRFDLMPPPVMERIGQHYANGIAKYGERNYELGQKTSRYLASLMRHYIKYMSGERDEDHLAAIVWNACGVMLNEYMVSKGIYDIEIHDYVSYTTRNEWDRTVKRRALEFNEELRRQEQSEADMSPGTSVDPAPLVQPFVCESCKHDDDDVDSDVCLVCHDCDQFEAKESATILSSEYLPYEERSCANCQHSAVDGSPTIGKSICLSCNRLSNWEYILVGKTYVLNLETKEIKEFDEGIGKSGMYAETGAIRDCFNCRYDEQSKTVFPCAMCSKNPQDVVGDGKQDYYHIKDLEDIDIVAN